MGLIIACHWLARTLTIENSADVPIPSYEPYIDVLTIASKSTPTDPVSSLVNDLRLSFTHFQIKIAVVGIDAVLYFSPEKDRDGLIIDIDGFTIIGHLAAGNGREPPGSLPLQMLR